MESHAGAVTPYGHPEVFFKNVVLKNFAKFTRKHLHWSCRSSHRRFSIKKGVLKNFAKFTGKHLCQGVLFNKMRLIKNETLAQAFCCEFCEIFKNTFFTEHLRMTAFAVANCTYKCKINFDAQKTNSCC